MTDMMNSMFRSGVPYDAETHTFQVRPEHMHLIEQQRQQIDEEQTRAFHSPSRSWWDWWDE